MEICNSLNCTNVAMWQVGFTFRPIDGRPPLVATTGLKVCSSCKENLHIEDIISDELQEACREILASLGAILDPTGYKLQFTALL